MQRQLSMAWEQWQFWFDEVMEQRRKLAQALGRLRHRKLSMAWNTWREKYLATINYVPEEEVSLPQKDDTWELCIDPKTKRYATGSTRFHNYDREKGLEYIVRKTVVSEAVDRDKLNEAWADMRERVDRAIARHDTREGAGRPALESRLY